MNDNRNNSIEEIAKVFEKAHRITLVSHRRPDGDTLGACLGLGFFLKAQGKDVTFACVDRPSKRLAFLPGVELYKKHFLYDIQDLIVVCDAGDSKMTTYHEILPDFLSNIVPILNIDHHISNDYFGKYNLVDAMASSASLIVYELFKELGWEFTEDIATCLLTGIYNDTGGFMHSNSDLRSFRAGAELARAGARPAMIARQLLIEKPVKQLRLWGYALERLHMNRERVVSSVLTQGDVREAGALSEDTGGVIDLINTAEGSKYSVLVTEDERGFLKGSFRTRQEDVDVAKIAAQFGGGGHKKAAGFSIKGKMRQENVWKIVKGG